MSTNCARIGCPRPPAPGRHGICWQHYERDVTGRVAKTAPARRRRTVRPRHWGTDELLAEIEHLWGTDHPDSIAQRLGYRSGETLARRLYRIGRDDLARAFDRDRGGLAA